MKCEEVERFFEHIPRTGMVSVLLFCLHRRVKEFEKDPNQPFSVAFAYASVGYVFFQILHAFARAKYPHSLLFDFFSILCGFAAVVIALSLIFSNL